MTMETHDTDTLHGTHRQIEDQRDHAENMARLSAGPRDWPVDFNQENGQYQRSCIMCQLPFIGNKHRLVCRQCSRPSVWWGWRLARAVAWTIGWGIIWTLVLIGAGVVYELSH